MSAAIVAVVVVGLIGSARAQTPPAAPAPGVAAETNAPAFPDTPEGLFRYGQQMESDGKMVAAGEAYARFATRFPVHTQIREVLYRYAKCLDAIGKVDEAVEQLEAATGDKNARFKNRQDALFLLGKLYGDQGERERGCATFEMLLAEGAGMYEEEAINLCGGFYALQKKYPEAVGKLNLLKRRPESRFAERAAYKIVLIWLDAGNLEQAVEAVAELARQYPKNQDARVLMLRIANAFRAQRKFTESIAACEQLRKDFPAAPEAKAAGYVAGLCFRDQQLPDKALDILLATAKLPENVKSGVAAEAMVQAADILFTDKNDPEKAMELYKEAIVLANGYPDDERRQTIEELGNLRQAEYQFEKRNWTGALEFYGRLSKMGSRIDVLPRVMKCHAGLGEDPRIYVSTPAEIEFLRQRINVSTGTLGAAEAEVFITDQALAAALASATLAAPRIKCAETYWSILKRYAPEVLAEGHLASYACVQMGRAYAGAHVSERANQVTNTTWRLAADAFHKALEVDAQTPYARAALEGEAQALDAGGAVAESFHAYRRLYEQAGELLKTAKDDKALQEDRLGYLRSMLARADAEQTVTNGIAVARRIIDQEGASSYVGRFALFCIADLYEQHKDYPAAAKASDEFIDAYGPKRNAAGDFADGPMKAGSDEITQQIFEAAVRIARVWNAKGDRENTRKAYAWMNRNVPNGNRFIAEARFWLVMDAVQGQAGENKDEPRRLALQLWTNVVCAVPFDALPESAGGGVDRNLFYFWVSAPDMMRYPKVAILKAGETLSRSGDHAAAARVFAAYLSLYPTIAPAEGPGGSVKDETGYVARYALGREYVSLTNYDKMVEVYKPYLDGLREDRLRVSALRLMGYYAIKAENGDLKPFGMEAYAAILDEYGENRLNEWNQPIPFSLAERLRPNSASWDGIRMPAPAGLDFGQVRYSLGFVCWKNKDWKKCTLALTPFVSEKGLTNSSSRAKALFMLGKSSFKIEEYAAGVRALWTLITDHPNFVAVEEVFAQAAWGSVEMKDWEGVLKLRAEFGKRYPASTRRDYMDLYEAVALLHIPERRSIGYQRMLTLGSGAKFQEVRADVLFYQGRNILTIAELAGKVTPGEYAGAFKLFADSVKLYPKAPACLQAVKCAVAQSKWQDAKPFAERLVRDFPDADPAILREATTLSSRIQTELAKANSGGR